MADFMYVFRGGMGGGSPEQMQQHMQKWAGWMKDLSAKGHFKAGEPLEDAGKVVTGKKKAVTDGPYAEAKDLVGGYLVVAAETLDQATELSKGCPILEVDGSVEIRPVRTMQR